MLILQIVVLALIQGITEFLPISSSGHLLLVPIITYFLAPGVLPDGASQGDWIALSYSVWKFIVRPIAIAVRTNGGAGKMIGIENIVPN